MRLGKLAAALVLTGALGVGAAGFTQPAYAVGGIGNLFESLKAKQDHSAPAAQEEPDTLSSTAASNDVASSEVTTTSANREQEAKVNADFSYDLALLPHIGSFVLYSEDTDEAREAIKALQRDVMPEYSETMSLGGAFNAYSHCIEGTKGFVYRYDEDSGQSSVSFRCDLALDQARIDDLKHSGVRSIIQLAVMQSSVAGEYVAQLLGVPPTSKDEAQAALNHKVQVLNEAFEASMRPTQATVEFEFFRSIVDPSSFPEYRSGIFFDFADGTSGYADFLSDEDTTEYFDEFLALYEDSPFIDGMLDDSSMGAMLCLMLLVAYVDGAGLEF
ncbi:MAG TPA: hypothetical protein H9850_05445 [Candidatus Anaerobiospirillum pullistercoris]|uniref:Uncharacterized protein n=1 Tax=Candidatus Anaerobiospirillum pullistercoris TaxID=2838452 RepID=A0A9D1WD87_9GAMM|nr:hypothetical protein [Candidatus Anaerobiospirillum pullistercoris]